MRTNERKVRVPVLPPKGPSHRAGEGKNDANRAQGAVFPRAGRDSDGEATDTDEQLREIRRRWRRRPGASSLTGSWS